MYKESPTCAQQISYKLSDPYAACKNFGSRFSVAILFSFCLFSQSTLRDAGFRNRGNTMHFFGNSHFHSYPQHTSAIEREGYGLILYEYPCTTEL